VPELKELARVLLAIIEMAEAHVAAEAEGQAISGMVNQEQASELQAMGFSKNVSEKALFMVQGAGLEAAIEWIDQHSSDPDFEEELRVMGQADKPKSTLSPEEAAQKARELQQRLKMQRDEKEKQLELERERDRIRVGKEMIEAKRNHEETETKRFLEQRKKEKQDQERELKRMHEILRQDKLARTGQTGSAVEEERVKEKTPDEKMKHSIKTIKTLYPPTREPDVASTAFKTLRALASNLANNPGEDKYKRVRIENPTLHQRVGRLNGGIAFLNAIGFAALEEGFLINTEPNISLLNEAVRLLDEAIALIG
jgi:hypothetical protein